MKCCGFLKYDLTYNFKLIYSITTLNYNTRIVYCCLLSEIKCVTRTLSVLKGFEVKFGFNTTLSV